MASSISAELPRFTSGADHEGLAEANRLRPSTTSPMVTEPRRSPSLVFREVNMRLSAPKLITFWIAVAVAVIGIIASFVPVVSGWAFWLVVIAFIVLALGNLIEGL